eukprot:622149_1
MAAVAKRKRCRSCLKFSKEPLVDHKLSCFPRFSVCEECVSFYCDGRSWKGPDGKEDIYCRFCGEGDLGLLPCDSSACSRVFCIGCLMANLGETQFEKVQKLAEENKWFCLVCSSKPPNVFLKNVDVEFRSTRGGFSKRTFFQFDHKSKISAPPTFSGRPRKAISTSLFALMDDELLPPTYGMQYLVGLSRNIDKLNQHWPDWTLVVHYDPRSLRTIWGDYARKMVDLFAMHPRVQMRAFPDWEQFTDPNGNYKGLFGTLVRFLTLGEEDWDIVCVRDTDSLYSARDKNIQEEFFDSDKLFQIYRCNHYDFTVLGGGISARGPRKPGGGREAAWPTVREDILKFSEEHLRDPEKLSRDSRFNQNNFGDEFPYFCDQFFLEEHLLTKTVGKSRIDQICIESIHTPQRCKPLDERHDCSLKFTSLMNRITVPHFASNRALPHDQKARRFLTWIRAQAWFRALSGVKGETKSPGVLDFASPMATRPKQMSKRKKKSFVKPADKDAKNVAKVPKPAVKPAQKAQKSTQAGSKRVACKKETKKATKVPKPAVRPAQRSSKPVQIGSKRVACKKETKKATKVPKPAVKPAQKSSKPVQIGSKRVACKKETKKATKVPKPAVKPAQKSSKPVQIGSKRVARKRKNPARTPLITDQFKAKKKVTSTLKKRKLFGSENDRRKKNRSATVMQ